MSEPTPQELVEEIQFEVHDGEVVMTPVDPTLSHAGEAADAQAVGAALAGIASRIKVDGKSADEYGNIMVYATDIPVTSDEGSQTVDGALTALGNKTAETIRYQAGSDQTIEDVVGGIQDALEYGVTDAEIDDIFEGW